VHFYFAKQVIFSEQYERPLFLQVTINRKEAESSSSAQGSSSVLYWTGDNGMSALVCVLWWESSIRWTVTNTRFN